MEKVRMRKKESWMIAVSLDLVKDRKPLATLGRLELKTHNFIIHIAWCVYVCVFVCELLNVSYYDFSYFIYSMLQVQLEQLNAWK